MSSEMLNFTQSVHLTFLKYVVFVHCITNIIL